MFPPLFGHRPRKIAVALRSAGRSRNLDLNDQQRESDRENCVAEPFEAVEAALRPEGFSVGLPGHQRANTHRTARLLMLKARRCLSSASHGIDVIDAARSCEKGGPVLHLRGRPSLTRTGG